MKLLTTVTETDSNSLFPSWKKLKILLYQLKFATDWNGVKMLSSLTLFDLQCWRNNQISNWYHGKSSLRFLLYPNIRQPQ